MRPTNIAYFQDQVLVVVHLSTVLWAEKDGCIRPYHDGRSDQEVPRLQALPLIEGHRLGIAYQHKIQDESLNIEQYGSGVEVRPWNIKPAQWVFLSDFLAGGDIPTERRLDPRFIFIESVTFSAPYDVQINGGKINTIKQLLASQGMR